MSLMRLILIIFAFFALLLTASCGERQDMTGTYRHVSDSVPGNSSVIILENNNKGVWETELDRINFTWSIHGDKIRLEKNSGETIAGEITEHGFQIELLRAGTFFFQKIKP